MANISLRSNSRSPYGMTHMSNITGYNNGNKKTKSRYKILDIRRALFCAKSYDMPWTYYPSFNLDKPSLLCRSRKTVNEDVWTWAERCTPSVLKSLWFHLWGQVHVLWQRHSPSWQAFSWHTYSETYVHRLRLAAMKDLACGRSREAGEVCWTKWQGYGALSSECPGWLRRFPFCTHMHCVGQYYSSQGGLLQVQGALLLRRLETILGRSCRERHLAHASEPRYSASRFGDNCVERPSPLPSWLSCLLRSKSSFQALLQWKYNGKTPSSNMFYTWIYAWASTLTVVALT